MSYSQKELLEEGGIWDKFSRGAKALGQVAKFAGQTLDPNTYNTLAGAANKTKEAFGNVKQALQSPETFISNALKDRGFKLINPPKQVGKNYIVDVFKITFDGSGKETTGLDANNKALKPGRLVVDPKGNPVSQTGGAVGAVGGTSGSNKLPAQSPTTVTMSSGGGSTTTP